MAETVLITGASRGIGAATARLFGEKGYNLILNCSKTYDELTTLQKEIEEANEGVNCLTIKADVSIASEVNYMFEAAAKRFGGVDILINNAGISHSGLMSDMDDNEWDRVLGTNLNSVFYCCRKAVPYMVSQKKGCIINVSSVWGLYGASCEVAYSTSKGGVNAFSKALAKELGPSGIRVNAIAFGLIDTDMNKCYTEEERAALADETAIGRFASPEEAADVIVGLATGHSYMTGQVIQFDGGWI
ncbi:MAG: SDR family NAD(P)-dependent oxidoreductase [Lachnospiraceae bacterium]|nr:SDR family NAD(P)-dependent oxidoreductase [Lachnospiraceae bacterium]